MKLLALLPLLSLAFAARAQTPALDFSGVDAALTVAPTQILVLASPHLSNMGDGVASADLEPLRDKLAAFRPDVITIESLTGEACETFLVYPNEYPEIAKTYCRDVAEFRGESGLDMISALAEVRATLQDWPTAPTAAQRRRLAAAFVAANDRFSALVQWLRLPADERVAEGALGVATVAYLNTLSGSLNENVQLGSMLAARVGLERVYPADDHSADALFASVPDSAWAPLNAIWRSNPVNMQVEYDRLDSLMASPDGMVKLYLEYGTPRMQRLSTDADFRRSMNDTSASGIGRRYVAWWQARNLRMVANIMAASAEAPGGRVLSVVGASHKPYFDAYLDQMHDVSLVDVEAVLKVGS